MVLINEQSGDGVTVFSVCRRIRWRVCKDLLPSLLDRRLKRLHQRGFPHSARPTENRDSVVTADEFRESSLLPVGKSRRTIGPCVHCKRHTFSPALFRERDHALLFSKNLTRRYERSP